MAPPETDELTPVEYLSAMSDQHVLAIRQAIPQYVDDESKASDETYQNMLNDGEVYSAISQRRNAILAEGYSVVPAVSMPRKRDGVEAKIIAEAETAQEIADFVEKALGPALIVSMAQSLEALSYGNAVHEIVLKMEGGKLVVDELIDLERRYQFEVEGSTVIGVKIKSAGSIGVGSTATETLIPMAKLLVHTNRQRGRDPRGFSDLWPAYGLCYAKQLVGPEFLRHLGQFGSPLIVGKTRGADLNPTGMVEVVDADGNLSKNNDGTNKLVTEGHQMYSALRKVRNGWLIVIPGGADITVEWPQGTGEPLREGLNYYDRSIHRAINGVSRQTIEAQHGSKADSSTAMDVFKLLVGRNQEDLGRPYTALAKLLTVLNFPPQHHHLAPSVVIGGSSQATWGDRADGIAKLTSSGFLDESQFPEMDAELGLPVRDTEAIAARKAEEKFATDQALLQQNEVTKP